MYSFLKLEGFVKVEHGDMREGEMELMNLVKFGFWWKIQECLSSRQQYTWAEWFGLEIESHWHKGLTEATGVDEVTQEWAQVARLL